MQLLSSIPECTILVSTKEDGSVSTLEDIDRVVRSVSNLSKIPVVLPIHEHSTRLREVTRENAIEVEFPADILLTREKQIALAHQFADCVPLLFVDRKRKAMCFAHAGWRGLLQGSVQVSLLAMQAAYGSLPQDVWVWIGPCIQKVSYKMEEAPCQSSLETWKSSIEKGKKYYLVDLPGFVTSECTRFGVDPTQIINDERDTYTQSEVFFSHQRYKKTEDETEKGNFAVVCWIN